MKPNGPMAQAREIIEEHEAKHGTIPAWWELQDAIAAAIGWAQLSHTPHRDSRPNTNAP